MTLWIFDKLHVHWLALGLLLGGIVWAQSPPQENSNAVILRTIEHLHSGIAPDGFWLLQAADVERFETGLRAFLQNHRNPDAPKVMAQLPQYYRQYAGIVQDGRHLIYANFFCPQYLDRVAVDWQREWIQVDDGGACFFQVLFEPSTGEYVQLSVNGEG